MSRHAARARSGSHRASLYDEITTKIIAELEAGRVPWVQPWGTAAAKAPLAMPKNAANLASLPYSSLQRLQASVQRTQQLLSEAQRIAYDVQQIDQAFTSAYGSASMSASDQQLVAQARERWRNTVGGLQDAMRVQAGVVGNIDTNRAEMSALIGQSQGATGALQAAQAGNQLLALQAQQLADLTAVVAANGRAQALTEAERAAAAEQGREQRRRFLTPGVGYQPGNARMFPNDN